jgi:hypothetical protein
MKILIALFSAIVLAGCATGGNQAYTAAHEAASKRGIAEANARAESDKTLALAVASAAKSCESDVCRMGAMLTFANMKAIAGAAIQSAAPAIAAPVNEVLEWAKVLVPAATGAYTAYLGTALGIVNATKGAADVGTANNALISVTPVSPFATTPAQ